MTVLLVLLGVGLLVVVVVTEILVRRAVPRPAPRRTQDYSRGEGDPVIIPLLARLDKLDERYEHYNAENDARYTRFTLRLAAAVVVALLGVVALAIQGRVEARERVNETCRLFEQRHRFNVGQLKQTYDYLAHPPGAGERNLYRLVLVGLPATEERARAERPPAYCEPTDVGLRDRNPGLPERPPSVIVPKRP